MKFVCFHKPEEENGFFSNWYQTRFEIGSMWFTSVEQYMMYRKAIVFHDEVHAAQIMATDDAARIRELGRQVSGYSEVVWNGMRHITVYQGLMAKFSQNGDLKRMLLETGDAMLVECAIKDRIWGIGLAMDDPDRFDMQKWNGRNLLGFALMMVRQQLRDE